MPKPNDANIHYHLVNEGFSDEKCQDGTARLASDPAHTHQRYLDTAGGSLVVREFNEVAVRFGPLAAGEWEIVIWDKASLDAECSAMVLFAIGQGDVVASRDDSAVLHMTPGPAIDVAMTAGTGGGSGNLWLRGTFSIPLSSRYISLITKGNPPTQPGDYLVSLRRLRNR